MACLIVALVDALGTRDPELRSNFEENLQHLQFKLQGATMPPTRAINEIVWALDLLSDMKSLT